MAATTNKTSSDKSSKLPSSCIEYCIKNCTKTFDEETKNKIDPVYWTMNIYDQAQYISGNFRETPVTEDDFETENLKNEKKIFISTLGYKSIRKINRVIELDQKIKEHIAEIFQNSPTDENSTELFFYSTLRIKKLFENFSARFEKICHINTWKLYLLNERHISFGKVHKQCQICLNHSLKKDKLAKNENWKKHYQLKTESSKEYETDRDKIWDSKNICVSVDLQNVVLNFNETKFNFYNQSFVAVGKINRIRNFSTVWHQGNCGSEAKELISTIDNFLRFNQDAETFRIWLSSTSNLKENWAFYSFLVYIINSGDIEAKIVEVCFYEPGHTLTSAFDFNYGVEENMKKTNSVYDFQKFVDYVQGTTKLGKVQLMTYNDFSDWINLCSDLKLKNVNTQFLKEMVKAVFTRGSTEFRYYKSFDGDGINVDFLVSAAGSGERALTYQENDGINKINKNSIIHNGFLPPSYKKFWSSLPVRNLDKQ